MPAFLVWELPELWELETTFGEKLPGPLASLAVKRAAVMTEEEQRSFHDWAPGHSSTAQGHSPHALQR